jgi:hypothetical protein
MKPPLRQRRQVPPAGQAAGCCRAAGMTSSAIAVRVACFTRPVEVRAHEQGSAWFGEEARSAAGAAGRTSSSLPQSAGPHPDVLSRKLKRPQGAVLTVPDISVSSPGLVGWGRWPAGRRQRRCSSYWSAAQPLPRPCRPPSLAGLPGGAVGPAVPRPRRRSGRDVSGEVAALAAPRLVTPTGLGGVGRRGWQCNAGQLKFTVHSLGDGQCYRKSGPARLQQAGPKGVFRYR